MQPKNLGKAFYVSQESLLNLSSHLFSFSLVLLDYVMLKGLVVFASIKFLTLFLGVYKMQIYN